MKKKFFACALAVTAVTSAAAFAGCGLFGGGKDDGDDKSFIQDNMRFELKDDDTYELARYEYADLRDGYDEDDNFVEGYKGDGETVTVPDTVNGKAVTSVKGYAFSGTGVKQVTLPDTISVLPDRIFDSCVLLQMVDFPAVTSVGKLAFSDCTKLESIAFESGLIEIGERAFEGCSALATLTLPDTVKTIGANCFYGCAFESVNTAGVEALGNLAFYNCANVVSFNLPNIVTIGERAFGGCEKLTEMTIGNRLESCAANLNVLSKISIDSPVQDKMFQWAENLSDVTLGEGVTSIGEMAFGYCFALKNISLPATLTEIGDQAFWESGLTAVTIPASLKTVSEEAFYACRSLVSLTIENGVESIGESAFKETGITSLSLPASVKSVGDKAFADCNSLSQIKFNEGLETIGDLAFAIKGAATLDIVLPTTVKAIGGGCFNYGRAGDKGITANKIIINNTVESVGENILKDCKVKELTVPANYGHNASSVQTLTLFGDGDIPAYAYRYCTALKTVNLSAGVKRIGANAFNGLESINLGGVEYLGTYALGDLSSLAYTKSENGVNSIDGWVISSDYSNGGATGLDLSGYTGIYGNAFRKTETNDTSVLTTVALVGSDETSNLKFIGERAFAESGITAVEVPASVQAWDGAFRECRSLSNIAIQRGVKKIADSAFTDCTRLEGLDIAATDVVEIGNSAFSGCKNLRLATLPNGIKKIGNYAFNSCTALMSVDLKAVEEIGESAFYRCTSLTEYDLPACVTEIGESALGCAEVINYAGTPEQWSAIDKGGKYKHDIWQSSNDLIVNFGDGGSVTLKRKGS
ncbi:MAG: leucine-rich repeat domain-containing protein [Clostridia bacterium]|nr:leucine-rich repeat domain-containing protein [Clostridia bacterium]